MLLARALLPDGAGAEEQWLCQVGFGQQATTFGSYLLGLDRDLPPPAKLLCDFYNSPTPSNNRDALLKHLRSGAPPTMTAAEVAASIDGIDPALSKPKSAVVIFKTARSGSTFFTELTRSLMSSAASPAASSSDDDDEGTVAVVEHWEPFCDRRCYHRNLPSLEESAFSLLLSRCRVMLDTYAMLCPEEGADAGGEGEGAGEGQPKQEQREGEGKADGEQDWGELSVPLGEASRRDASRLAPLLKEIGETCSAQREAGLQAEASITALNPRFSDRVRWAVLAEEHLAPDTSTIINLRRTNLVRMAYSKFHHQGCGVAGAGAAAAASASTGGGGGAVHARSAAAVASSVQRPEHRLRANGTATFGLEALLRCTWHYSIGDQEFATATALTASMASGAPLHLVLYEDVLGDAELVKQNAAAFLGLVGEAAALAIEATSSSRTSTSTNASKVKEHPAAKECVQGGLVQCHSEGSLCSYADVACEGEGEQATLAGLAAYPCLLKQWMAPQEAVWSMPLLEDGSIDLKGDCHRLQALALLPSKARAVPSLYAQRPSV